MITTAATPSGTAISVESGAVSCRIDSCHIADFANGIAIGNGAVLTRITNCKVDTLAGLTIAPAGDMATIYGVFVTACSFGMIENNSTTSGTWGISIDTTGGINTNVEGICIDNCMAYGYPNAGLQIKQGQSISVIGGKYSSNGQNPTSTELGAGIAIFGACADVRIVGADCSGVFDFWATVESSLPPPQPYGISVVSGATGICVADCNVTNNAMAPLYVPSAETDLRVTDCVGYNDQAKLLADVAPAPGVIFSASYFNYYGPMTFYVSGGTDVSVNIDGYPAAGLTSGSFALNPAHSGELFYTDMPDFTALGM